MESYSASFGYSQWKRPTSLQLTSPLTPPQTPPLQDEEEWGSSWGLPDCYRMGVKPSTPLSPLTPLSQIKRIQTPNAYKRKGSFEDMPDGPIPKMYNVDYDQVAYDQNTITQGEGAVWVQMVQGSKWTNTNAREKKDSEDIPDCPFFYGNRPQNNPGLGEKKIAKRRNMEIGSPMSPMSPQWSIPMTMATNNTFTPGTPTSLIFFPSTTDVSMDEDCWE